MPLNHPLPQIIHEPSYSEKTDKYLKQYPRMKDVLDAIDWEFARDPESGIAIYSHYRVFKTTRQGATPSFIVLYHYDKDTSEIRLYSIEAIEIRD